MTHLYSKLYSFSPKISYQTRTLDELNSLCDKINDSKFKLSNSLQYYLQKYRELLDIPRLCRALALPGEIASQFIEAEKSKTYLDGLDKVKHVTNEISSVLGIYLNLQNNNNISNQPIAPNLTGRQKRATYDDINELAVYSKMYYDIESVKSDPLISDEYPYGNPFDHIIDIMNYGAINLTYGKHYDVITKMIICMV